MCSPTHPLSKKPEASLIHTHAVHEEPQPATTFPFFPLLPPELRLLIWTNALPSSRTLKVKVDAYSSTEAELLGPFAPIPSIMHVNSEARSVALRICRLGLGPTIGPEKLNFYWDPSVDMVYLPPSAAWTNGVLEEFLCRGCGDAANDGKDVGIPKDWANDGFMQVVRHIALPLNVWLAQGLYLEPVNARWLIPWLRRLPALQSVTLLVEPYDQWLGPPDTRAVYHEPLDVPMSQLLGMKPSEIEEQVEEALGRFAEEEMRQREKSGGEDEGYGSGEDMGERGREGSDSKAKEEWETPFVEVLVLGMKKYKPDPWCIAPRTNLDRDDVTGLWETRPSREERNARRLRNRWPAEVHAVEQWGRMGMEDEEIEMEGMEEREEGDGNGEELDEDEDENEEADS
ncbi:hypothetical protein ACMFMG_011275 [Clarireedia jacksonii]